MLGEGIIDELVAADLSAGGLLHSVVPEIDLVLVVFGHHPELGDGVGSQLASLVHHSSLAELGHEHVEGLGEEGQS